MKEKNRTFTQRYQSALRAHLKSGRPAAPMSALGLGSLAMAAGVRTLELAKLHERILVGDLLPGCPASRRDALVRRAAGFFAAALIPIERSSHAAAGDASRLKQFVEALSRRTVELAASNLELNAEITQRKAVEEELKKSERHYSQLLDRSARLQDQLRLLSRQILSAQEEERKRISRELHDVIAQTLTGINIRLATLKREAATNTTGLDRNIALTQLLVAKSVNIVHQFARELRPAVLDDLGLIPALTSFLKAFSARTGIRARLRAFAGVEQLDIARRTVLYRVAQECLTNVARHARASRVDILIRNQPAGIEMRVSDNGRSFRVDRALSSHGRGHLGLLGMRERLEMVGGRFGIESAKGRGTTVTALLPSSQAAARPAAGARLPRRDSSSSSSPSPSHSAAQVTPTGDRHLPPRRLARRTRARSATRSLP